ncbi:MAG: hypothetical protein IKO47_10490 [Ruminococcus sp.]|nr:hypothetical protein [Ruminococcus sp.]
MNYRKIALIPAYEPDGRIVTLARELDDNGFSVIIVNDGSGTGSASVFSAATGHAEILMHIHNHGRGASVRTGLEYIRKYYLPPYTVTVLSQETEDVSEALAASDEAAAMPGNLVLGVRREKNRRSLRSIVRAVVSRLWYGAAFSTGERTGTMAFSHRHIDRLLSVSGDREEYENNVIRDYVMTGESIIHTAFSDTQNSGISAIGEMRNAGKISV